jgi:hypothetical protein
LDTDKQGVVGKGDYDYENSRPAIVLDDAQNVELTDEPEAVIEDLDEGLTYGVKGELPAGAAFDEANHTFTFTPEAAGEYEIVFTVDDGVILVEKQVTIVVAE